MRLVHTILFYTGLESAKNGRTVSGNASGRKTKRRAKRYYLSETGKITDVCDFGRFIKYDRIT